jgi:peptidoglycan-associated lipoprotein
VLSKQAEWFAANLGATATVEGHADERGTREYNLALGARRANSARAYLIGQGVDGNRLRTVSYGKERPVAVGSDEGAWAQNRRAVSVVVGAPTS